MKAPHTPKLGLIGPNFHQNSSIFVSSKRRRFQLLSQLQKQHINRGSPEIKSRKEGGGVSSINAVDNIVKARESANAPGPKKHTLKSGKVGREGCFILLLVLVFVEECLLVECFGGERESERQGGSEFDNSSPSPSFFVFFPPPSKTFLITKDVIRRTVRQKIYIYTGTPFPTPPTSNMFTNSHKIVTKLSPPFSPTTPVPRERLFPQHYVCHWWPCTLRYGPHCNEGKGEEIRWENQTHAITR